MDTPLPPPVRVLPGIVWHQGGALACFNRHPARIRTVQHGDKLTIKVHDPALGYQNIYELFTVDFVDLSPTERTHLRRAVFRELRKFYIPLDGEV